jgi:hypothetical protein
MHASTITPMEDKQRQIAEMWRAKLAAQQAEALRQKQNPQVDPNQAFANAVNGVGPGKNVPPPDSYGGLTGGGN